MRKFFSALCIALAIVIAVIAISYYFPKLKDYADNLIMYRDIRNEYTRDPEPAGEDDEEDELRRYLRSLGLDPDVYGPIYVDSEGLLGENEDYLGWVYIPKTQISYPVVQGVDNDEYLHADYYKNYNFAGTIFMDYRCDEGLYNHHTILYGHNMRIGTMFAGLNNFKDQSYIDEHPIFWFITPEEFILYIDFSVCTPNPYDRMQYGIDGYDFKTDEEYEEAVNTMIEQSIITAPIFRDVSTKDYIMSLSTCTGDSSVRCILHGIKEKGFKISENQHSYVHDEAEDETGDGTESYIESETESNSENESERDVINRIENMATSLEYNGEDPETHGTSYSTSENHGTRLTADISASSGYSHSESTDSTNPRYTITYGSSSGHSLGTGAIRSGHSESLTLF